MIKSKYKNEAIGIITKKGRQHQINKAVEELAELIRALSKSDRSNIVEETADVLFMILQIQLIFDIQDETMDKMIEEKIARLEKNDVCNI